MDLPEARHFCRICQLRQVVYKKSHIHIHQHFATTQDNTTQLS